MTLGTVNGSILAVLSIVASGYLIYDMPLLRLWWSKSAGYILYFRTLVVGLILTLLIAFPPVLNCIDALLSNSGSFPNLTLNFASAPFAAFIVALIIRAGIDPIVWVVKKANPNCEKKLNLAMLAEKELGRLIYEKLSNDEMVMVTLKSNKVYTGWPVRALGRDEIKWLQLVPQWSGYRDENGNVTVQVDYSKVIPNTQRDDRNRMLIPVDKVVTIHSFNENLFAKFQKPPSKKRSLKVTKK